MCKLRRKLLMFDYVIGKLVEWETSKDYEDLSSDEINVSLKNFSGVRLMKLLYFICLVSVYQEYKNKSHETVAVNPEEGNQEISTLFRLFDNYVALDRGPAEADAYANRSFLLNYAYRSSSLSLQQEYADYFKSYYPEVAKEDYNNTQNRHTILLKQLSSDSNNAENEVPLDSYKTMVDRAIEFLRFRGNIFPYKDVEKLVDITHELPLWNKYYRSENKKYALSMDELLEEKNSFVAKYTNN